MRITDASTGIEQNAATQTEDTETRIEDAGTSGLSRKRKREDDAEDDACSRGSTVDITEEIECWQCNPGLRCRGLHLAYE